MSEPSESSEPMTPQTPPQVIAVIPARYGSTRFAGKPLALIDGRPMIQHVFERVLQVPGVDQVWVATDDARIEAACRGFGAPVKLTDPAHPSGTDRVWETVAALKTGDTPPCAWVLNVQGDEPRINPGDLARLIAESRTSDADILTMVTPIASEAEFLDPNIVKAVLTDGGRALYFSRAAVPADRDHPGRAWQAAWRHVGVYLYRTEALARLTSHPPVALEQAEKLEQLRALALGMTIAAIAVDKAPVGVDTPEDLRRLLETPG